LLDGANRAQPLRFHRDTHAPVLEALQR
jgi:hypothetical protein